MSSNVAMVIPYGWLSVSPSLQNECRVLANNGCEVDLFYFNDESHSDWTPDVPGIRVHSLRNRLDNTRYAPSPLPRMEQATRLLREVSVDSYDLVIGVDIMGLVYARLLCKRARTPPPVVYHSLESMLATDRLSVWLEQWATEQAVYGITMADSWARGISDRTSLAEEEIFVVPNSSIAGDSEFDETFLQDWIDVPDDRNVVVYAGSFIPSHMVGDIVDTVAEWPDDWMLLVHGWGPEERIPELEERAGSLLDDRVVISNEVLPDEEYTDLIASADVGISLYDRSIDENKWRYGHPGKVYKYLETSTPIIASDTPSLTPLIADNECGVCISDPASIPDALHAVSDDYDTYSNNCRTTFEEHEFASNYQAVIDRLRRDGVLE